MSSLVSVTGGFEEPMAERVPLAGMYSGLLELRSLSVKFEGGAATTEEEISWYIVLWSVGWEGSWRRPAPAVLVAPERKVKRMERLWEMDCRVRIR